MEFESETEIWGKYADQPGIKKIGGILLFLASMDFLIFVPISVGAAVIGGVGKPAAHPSGTYLSFLILAGMLSIGAWITYMWLGWLTGGWMSGIGRWIVFFLVSLVSAGVSAAVVIFQIWPVFFLCIGAFVPIGILTGAALVTIGQMIHGKT